MKTVCFLLMLSLLLFSCKETIPTENNNSTELSSHSVSLYNPEVSLPCNICLLKDSMQQLWSEIYMAKAFEEPVDSSFYVILDSLDLKKTNWEEKLREILPNEMLNRWQYRSTERIALELCLEEYAFDRLDSIERRKYFFEYRSYHNYTNVAELFDDIDTAEFKEANGNYLLKFHGESIRISPTEFPAYWENGLYHHTNARNYIDAQMDQRLFKITGKHTQELTEIEKLMFNEHENAVNGFSIGSKEYLKLDTTLKRLVENHECAWTNDY